MTALVSGKTLTSRKIACRKTFCLKSEKRNFWH